MASRGASLAPVKVFISYSHDSPEHSARVLKLAHVLGDMGLHVELDQFVTRPKQGGRIGAKRGCGPKTPASCSSFVRKLIETASRIGSISTSGAARSGKARSSISTFTKRRATSVSFRSCCARP